MTTVQHRPGRQRCMRSVSVLEFFCPLHIVLTRIIHIEAHISRSICYIGTLPCHTVSPCSYHLTVDGITDPEACSQRFTVF